MSCIIRLVSVRWHFLPAIALLLVSILGSCNRVPGNEKSGWALVESALSLSDEAVPAVAVVGMDDPSVPFAASEDVVNMCARACGHWVGLQFADPVGLLRLTDKERERVDEILERQRALNRADCEDACAQRRDGDRARCVLQSLSPEQCQACVRS
ncbi:MAG: hypothetical protein ACI9WU_004636 [Myxococcota bacterium]|jgi:hypothetical protein